MSAAMGNELKAEPNLTPLLDVVFQLITFFMLVINFSQDNFDSRIKLPVAGSARPHDDAAKLAEDRLVLNVDSQGHLLLYGRELTADEATGRSSSKPRSPGPTSRRSRARSTPPQELPARVVIRADRDTPFSALFQLISTCQSNGYAKFDLKAMTGP